ncbi:MAG: hypothetical protein ABFR65_13330 [Pseudomonadota bacterium]
MIDSLKLVSLPVLLTMSLAAGSVVADTAAGPEKSVSKEQIFAGARNQVVLDGQQFKNVAQEDQLRHRVNENLDKGEKNRYEKQQGKQSKNQHQYQYKNQSGSQHMHQSQSGSMSRGGKGGGGGGGGRR